MTKLFYNFKEKCAVFIQRTAKSTQKDHFMSFSKKQNSPFHCGMK